MDEQAIELVTVTNYELLLIMRNNNFEYYYIKRIEDNDIPKLKVNLIT